MKLSLSFIALLLLLCPACDTMRRINMKNETNDTVHIIWHMVKDSIGFNPFVLNNSDELAFHIPPHQNNEVKLSFGEGNWTSYNIDQLMKYLVSLQILSPGARILYSTPGQISSYLMANRKGFGGKKIAITVSQ